MTAIAANRKVVLLDNGEEANPYRYLLLVGLITTAILEVLDTTIVNVALPQMAGNFGATTEQIGWVATGYILANLIVLPMTAWLSSRFGRKRYLLASISIFLIASFLCGTSHSLNEMVLWRIIQGSGGAALISTVQATMREIFPREQQGTIQSIYIAGVVVAPTIGPTLGGWITDNYSWPWIFFVNIPIGLFAMAVIYLFLTDATYKMNTSSIDWYGVFYLAVGLGSLQYVLEEGNRDYWFDSVLIVRLSIVSAVAIFCFIYWELSPRNRVPIVNLRVIKNRDLLASLALIMSLGFGLYGGIFLFPLFSQNILGFTATDTGLALLPGGIATALSALTCGRLLNGAKPLANPRFLMILGLSIFIYSMWSLGHLTSVSGEANTQVALIIRGLGLGLLFTPINQAAFNSLKGVEIAQGASMLNLCRQLGGSFGIAILSTYLDNMRRFHTTMLNVNLSPENPIFQQRLKSAQSVLLMHGMSATSAKMGAMGLIEQSVVKQASTMSFNDAFLLIGAVSLFVSPMVFVFRSRKSNKAKAAAVDAH